MHEELDVSGATMDRPQLDAALSRIESGLSEGLVVFKLDRFGRTLVASLQTIERIERAGGLFASVEDGFDLGTETGRLVLRIMLSLAEFELDRIRNSWNESRRQAVGRGIHPTPTPPFGYRHGEGGRLEVVPEEADLVARIFAMRASGENWSAVRAMLREAGARTRRGNDFALRAVRDIVRSKVYLGPRPRGTRRPQHLAGGAAAGRCSADPRGGARALAADRAAALRGLPLQRPYGAHDDQDERPAPDAPLPL
jgi:DNA invertase Pin-like site-specific DNA recombinase